MRMTRSATAELSPRPKPCASLLRRGSRPVGWCYTRRKRKSSTARIPTARDAIPTVQFDFLGYTFRPRFTAWPNGTYGVSFLPAASQGALKAMRREVRQWRLQSRTHTALNDLARMVNPSLRGWINYYSHFYQSVLHDSLRRIDFHLRKWARRKYKRFKQKPKSAREWLARIIRTNPEPFAHWPLLYANSRILGAG